MFGKLGVAARIYLGLGLMLAMVVGLAALASFGSTAALDQMRRYKDSNERVEAIDSVRAELMAARMAVARFLLIGNAGAAAADARTIASLRALSMNEPAYAAAFGGSAGLEANGRALSALSSEYADAFEGVMAVQTDYAETLAPMVPVARAAGEAFATAIEEAGASRNVATVAKAAEARAAFLLARNHTTKFVDRDDFAEYDAAQARLAEAAGDLDSLARMRGNAPLAAAATEAAEELRAYSDGLTALRALTERRVSLLDSVIYPHGPKMLAIAREALDAVDDEGDAVAERTIVALEMERRLVVTLGAAATLLGLALAFVIARWTAGGVRRMAETMSRMAEGDLDVSVTGAEHRHELGEMARALKVFQTGAVDKRRLDEKAREAAERERAAAAEQSALQNAVRETVERAAAGDFSRRVDPRYGDDALNGFAELVNRLLDSVRGGVSETARVMEAVANGDLSAEMRGAFEGAFADLQANVNATVARLRDTVDRIKAASGAMRRSTGEISQGASDLSQRAENQAASLEEIAATMEQLAATVKTNAENAQSARGLSDGAAERARTGGDVVSKAVTAMGQIEESSGKIADIVSVIDGFAFQTNLLALNAAVEAARAGEAGKGFAVVASEVRQLAQRSAEAARDIKDLIDASAVHVGDGVSLVRETGSSLSALMEAIGQVGETIAEISEASREQSAGVEEIAATVTGLDETTQQTSAIADESASAAKGLADEAARLEEQMRFFSTEGRAAGRGASRAA